MSELQTWTTAQIAASDLRNAEIALAGYGLKVKHLGDWYEVMDTYVPNSSEPDPYPHGIIVSSAVGGLPMAVPKLDLFLDRYIFGSSNPVIVAARVVDPRRTVEANEVIDKLVVWSDADLITIQVPGPVVALGWERPKPVVD